LQASPNAIDPPEHVSGAIVTPPGSSDEPTEPGSMTSRMQPAADKDGREFANCGTTSRQKTDGTIDAAEKIRGNLDPPPTAAHLTRAAAHQVPRS
jgi:hypothetical protein